MLFSWQNAAWCWLGWCTSGLMWEMFPHKISVFVTFFKDNSEVFDRFLIFFLPFLESFRNYGLMWDRVSEMWPCQPFIESVQPFIYSVRPFIESFWPFIESFRNHGLMWDRVSEMWPCRPFIASLGPQDPFGCSPIVKIPSDVVRSM